MSPGQQSGVAQFLPPGLGWPALVQSLATLFFMEPLVRHDLRRFDGLMTFRLLGLGEMVVVWDPELIKELFTGDRDVLPAGEANARVLHPAGPNSYGRTVS